METPEEQYVAYFYTAYKGRIAIGVGYAQDMVEVFPLVLDDAKGNALGIIAMATLSNNRINSVHIFHLGAFQAKRGDGSAILDILCLKADEMQVTLSLSPIPAPNGESGQITSGQLLRWYRKFGFTGDGLLQRAPRTDRKAA